MFLVTGCKLQVTRMNSYRDLDIFKESKRLAIQIHKISLSLPKFELFEEGGQARRSAKAVTSLIVEGYGRKRYKADFIKYLVFAHAECDETIIHLEFLSKKINKFNQWVEEHWNEAE